MTISREDENPVQPLVDEAMKKIFHILIEGLAPDQALWAVDAYRNRVLPDDLKYAPEAGEKERKELVEIEADNIRSDLQGLPPAQKWAVIRENYYFTQLLPLSHEAFDLAQQAHAKSRPREELAAEAQRIHAELNALVETMKREAPDVREQLSEELSETTLDCDYVICNLDIVSLRMGRVLRLERESGKCPACGAANPTGSRFCNQCGHKLES